MRAPVISLCLLLAFFQGSVKGQDAWNFQRTDSASYALYQRGEWKSLLQYGKQALSAGQDFPLLRLRLGYAAYMLGNFSEAIRQYEAVLKSDRDNSFAHQFIYWSRIQLNQPEMAMAERSWLDAERLGTPLPARTAITAAGTEISYKQTNSLRRGNPFYARGFLEHRLLPRLHWHHSLVTYQQQINEPLLTGVQNNEKIVIHQFEYYSRAVFNLNRHWQLKGAWHYLHTPFNNLVYNNHLFLGGLHYYDRYFSVQADYIGGTLIDAPFSQFNLQAGLYPFGNLNLYSFSTGIVRSGKVNFKQVLGGRVRKNVWLEGHTTLGRFRNLAENDALYLYNAIDTNTFKGGAQTIILLGGGLRMSAGYTFEKRQLYRTSATFHQHSITGGLSWTF